jgi:hypothetical protein
MKYWIVRASNTKVLKLKCGGTIAKVEKDIDYVGN